MATPLCPGCLGPPAASDYMVIWVRVDVCLYNIAGRPNHPGKELRDRAVRSSVRIHSQVSQHFKSPSLVRCFPVVTTMAHNNRSYPQGYSFPGSFQSFTLEDWEAWIALCVCVIHFVFMRAYALTDLVHRRTRLRLSRGAHVGYVLRYVQPPPLATVHRDLYIRLRANRSHCVSPGVGWLRTVPSPIPRPHITFPRLYRPPPAP